MRQSARIRTDGVGRAGALLEMAQEIVNRGHRRVVRTDDAWAVRIRRDVDVEDRHGLILRGAARANGLATPRSGASRLSAGTPASPPGRAPRKAATGDALTGLHTLGVAPTARVTMAVRPLRAIRIPR